MTQKPTKPDYLIHFALSDEEGKERLVPSGALWMTKGGKSSMTGTLDVEAGEAREIRVIMQFNKPAEEVVKLKKITEALAALIPDSPDSTSDEKRQPDLNVLLAQDYVNLKGKKDRRYIPLGGLWTNTKSGFSRGSVVVPQCDHDRKLRILVNHRK